MHKFIYLALLLLSLAPVSAFAQMGTASYYSNIWIDDSWAHPADGSEGVIYIDGLSVTVDDENPWSHSYETYSALYYPGGGMAAYDGGGNISFAWNGSEGTFQLMGYHETTCFVCSCSWMNNTGATATASLGGYTELYYNNPVPLVQHDGELPTGWGVYGYTRCAWCNGCQCSAWYNQTTTYKCPCGSAPTGLREDYKVTTWSIPFLGDFETCKFTGAQHPLGFDPCVYPAPWNPECSITNPFPKPLP